MKSNKGSLGRTWMRGMSFSKNENKGKGRFPPSRVKLSLVMLIVDLGTTKKLSSRNPPYLSSQFEVLTIVTLLNLRHSFLKRYTLIAPSGGRESTSKRRSVIFSIKSFILVPAGAAVASPWHHHLRTRRAWRAPLRSRWPASRRRGRTCRGSRPW